MLPVGVLAAGTGFFFFLVTAGLDLSARFRHQIEQEFGNKNSEILVNLGSFFNRNLQTTRQLEKHFPLMKGEQENTSGRENGI